MKRDSKMKKNNWFLMFFRRMGIIKYIFLVYILITIIISLFLFWPITHNKTFLKDNSISIKYSDAFFLAASAFSDTGLSSIPGGLLGFNQFGQFLIALSIMVGGLGIFTLKVYILQNILGIKLTVFNGQLSQMERGGNTIGETKKIIKVSITTMLITLFVLSVVFTIIFYTSPYGKFDTTKFNQNRVVDNITMFNPYEVTSQNPKGDFTKSIRYGIFHAISSLNNAGLDIIGRKSLAPYSEEYALQIFTLIAIFIGGVGYPVIYDFYAKIKSFRKNENAHCLSLFTKLTLVTYLIVSCVGLLLTFIFECSTKNKTRFWNQSEYGGNWEKTFATFFQTMSTRSAGFSTIDYYHFTNQSIVVHSILMFIGFSPASTAGGIRNLTLSILFLSMISTLLGRRSVNVFKRQIGKETLIKAINIFTIGIILILIGTLVVYSSYTPTHLSQKEFTMVHALFEICSAFGSSGLSVGVTPNVNILGKIFLITYMIIGQLGIQQTILIWAKNRTNVEHYHYIYEDVALG